MAKKEEDFVSVILLEGLLKNKEEHYYWIEERIALIKLIGVGNYLKTQI